MAGSWYPSDASHLKDIIKLNVANTKPRILTHIPLIVVPHAAYQYCIHVAANAYGAIVTYKPDIIVIIGPSHYEHFSGCALPVYDAITTPLGTVSIDRKTIKKLVLHKYFFYNNNAFEPEHSIEIQLPYIQYCFKKVPIVPVLVGSLSVDEAKEAAKALKIALSYFKKPLYIISSDFMHHGPRFGYIPYQKEPPATRISLIKQADMKAIDYILSYNALDFVNYCNTTNITICGRNAILLGLFLFDAVHAKELISYSNSSDITADYDNTVSYAALLITGKYTISAMKEFSLSNYEKDFLLQLARESIHSRLINTTPFNAKEPIPKVCKEKAAAFVTLTIDGNLRGCVGYIEPIKTLYQTVIECAQAAAYNDPRFKPLSKEEFQKLDIEISVLSKLNKISCIDDLRLGIDGLVVAKGNRRGVLLPQVVMEHNMTKEEFFHYTCQKAGIHPFEYNDVTLYSFTVIRFSEEKKRKSADLRGV